MIFVTDKFVLNPNQLIIPLEEVSYHLYNTSTEVVDLYHTKGGNEYTILHSVPSKQSITIKIPRGAIKINQGSLYAISANSTHNFIPPKPNNTVSTTTTVNNTKLLTLNILNASGTQTVATVATFN